MKPRTKGESYRPIVRVEKTKGKLPTVLRISGNRYVLDHGDTKRGE